MFSASGAGVVTGQSLTSATLVGGVRDSLGGPLFDVAVTAIARSNGITRHAVTTRNGEFRIALLPPGEYDVRAEAIGYRPKLVRGVSVFPGNDVRLAVVLNPSPPPVDRVDTVTFAGRALSGRGSGMSQRYSAEGLADFADRRRDVTEQLRHASNATEVSTEGLPNTDRALVIDGVPFVAARHPGLADEPNGALVLPLLAVDRTELLTNPTDVEWSGSTGGYLAATTRRGGNDVTLDTYGDWSGDQTASSKYFNPRAMKHQTWRGGAALSGPLLRDTASFAVAIEARRAESVFSPLVGGDSAQAAILAVAHDTFGQDVAAYARPRLSLERVVSGFGRVDWQLTAAHALGIRANVGTSSSTAPDLGLFRSPSFGSRLTGTDFAAAAILTSRVSTNVAQELRFGVSRSQREYFSGSLAPTLLMEPALALGSDPALPGRFRRTEVRLGDVWHLGGGAHAFKLGVEGVTASIDDSYSEGRTGQFIFADAQHFALHQGAFTQTVGSLPNAQFSLPQLSGFLQDSWAAAPGLRLTLGGRFDYQRLPSDRVISNDSLVAITGLDNADVPTKITRLSPRFAVTWDPAGQGTWIIRGAVGVYTQLLDPGLFGELITYGGRVESRSAVGDVTGWPTLPDATIAPVRGRDVTLYPRAAEAPRASHFTLGVSRALGAVAALHLSGTYRHTDFLQRRYDLNLFTSAVRSDQHGRPVYGNVQQLGGQLATVPGSNRRFPAFDHIWVLDADGFSDYWGLTVGLERQSRAGLRLLANYTYSKTTDNWLSRPGVEMAAQLTPFPGGLNDQDWAEGTSDLDVPHQVSAGLALPIIPRAGVRLGVLYSYRSGYPFTPGFPDGVDLNADGSTQNDPAFIDDALPGTSDLFGTWSCLQRQSGRIASRNSCRAPGVHRLDLRLRIAPLQALHFRGELVLDALNLLDAADAIVDRALYLVNPKLLVTVNATSGALVVPLVTNANFGKPLIRLTPGRSLRVGLQLTR